MAFILSSNYRKSEYIKMECLSARSTISSRIDLINLRSIHKKKVKGLPRNQARAANESSVNDPPTQRRNLLQSLAIVGFSSSWLPMPSLHVPMAAAAAEARIIQVGKDTATISQALNLANDADTILLNAGKYQERVILDKAVSLVASPGADVEISWHTEDHYESTILCTADGAKIQNITIRHFSPSVANNYAVFSEQWGCP